MPAEPEIASLTGSEPGICISGWVIGACIGDGAGIVLVFGFDIVACIGGGSFQPGPLEVGIVPTGGGRPELMALF